MTAPATGPCTAEEEDEDRYCLSSILLDVRIGEGQKVFAAGVVLVETENREDGALVFYF